MLERLSTLSLFDVLQQRLEHHLPAVTCSKATLLHLSHTLEDLILAHHIPALLFTGFQTPQNWRQEIERYQDLAQVARQIYIFADEDRPPPETNLYFVPLGHHWSLSQEWFIVILSESFSVILCGRERPAAKTPGAIRQFDTLWSFEAEVINSALDLLADIIALDQPEQLSPLQAARAGFSITNPDAAMITQFTMTLFHFEEMLQRNLLTTSETLQQTVTALDQRDAQLDRAEAQLRYQANLVENISDAIISTDLNFHIQSWNRAAETIYGWSAAEVIGRLLSDVIPTLYTTDQIEAIRNEFFKEGQWQGEVIQRCKDGKLVNIHNSATLFKDSAGQPVGIVAINRNITRRKQTEESLRKAQQAQQDLINSIDGIVWEADARTFQFLFVSSQAERLLGYPLSRWLDEPGFWQNHIHEADRNQAVNYCVRCTHEMKNHEFEYRMVAADGRLVWLRDIITVIVEDNRAVKLRGVMVDITQLKQAEEVLRNNEEKFRLLFELAPIGMALVAPEDGRFLRVNPAYCEMLGYNADELLTRRFADITHPDDINANLALDKQVLSGEIPYFQMEKRYIGQEGNIIYVLLQVSLARDSEGKPLHFISQVVDITERKHLEEQLRQSQKLEAIGRLAGGVAHDFNNLLTVINGYSDILIHLLSDNDPSRRDLEQIRKAGERAASLTRQLLAFSRQQILQPQILDLNLVVTEIDKMLRRLLGEHIELITQPQPGLGQIKADLGQIEQVIMNLAVNASDAMPQGGKLTIETANIFLDRTYTRQHINITPGPYVVLTVSDTGSGMDADTIAHIFEPFFTTKEIGKGTGLGLATVYGIVTQSGGHLQVYSEADKGTTFKIYFPRIEEVTGTSERAGQPAYLPQGLETILLAEDEPSVRALIQGILETNGYSVLEASSGREALEIGQNNPSGIDLLLTDVVMPKMSGPDLAQHLLTLHPDLKVLYISGYTDDAVIQHDVPHLKAAFLPKPFTPEDLARKVREVLDAE